MEFENKVVIITGASGGIGSATAKLFADNGAKLCLVGPDYSRLQEMVASLNISDDRLLLKECDVRNEAMVKSYVDDTVAKFGRIDVFINNAGIEGSVTPIINTNYEDLENVLAVNVKGVYLGLKYVLRAMYNQKSGSVINTSSVAGFIGSPGSAPYVASKHAVIGITKTAALEAAGYNVRVNAVCPGPVDNNMMRNIERKANPENPEAVKNAFNQMVPMGRYSTNEEIANIMYFLASDKASAITGVAYRVDGGMGAK
jgi:NAD(P)-dependent dehydrogenase (short-subunit alcohol dehydrogenase family)